jgi:hypothetical protein
MKSSALSIEPRDQPRLAAAALILHLFAAAFPWIARCPPWPGVILSLVALGGLAATLARVPGPHCRLRKVVCHGDSWRVMLEGDVRDVAAQLAPDTRVYAGLIVLNLRVGRRRVGWLLPRKSLGSTQFRQLKARLRMAC